MPQDRSDVRGFPRGWTDFRGFPCDTASCTSYSVAPTSACEVPCINPSRAAFAFREKYLELEWVKSKHDMFLIRGSVGA